VPTRILIVDDDPDLCRLVEAELVGLGYAVVSCQDAESALSRVAEDEFDLVITDVGLPGMHGIDLCERLVTNRPDVPVLVLTGVKTVETAIGAIRAGAWDFVTKPLGPGLLRIAVERALRHRELTIEIKRLRSAQAAPTPGNLIGKSAAMRPVYDLIGRVAPTDTTVLVTGESGTGKELVARALHDGGKRARGPFVAINCAALPETLLESELFGHAKGAFTDARSAKNGLFLQADGGTLFLDEIGELPLPLQAKLLRALQERTVRPVGGDRELPFDVRIVCATNRDLETAVEEKRFREDLYFRINVVHLPLPPLRARGGDILLLAQAFIERFARQTQKSVRGPSAEAADKLMTYRWPGNVRELQNAIERAVALTAFEDLTVEDLPEKVRSYRSFHVLVAGEDPSELLPMEEVERRYILRVLEALGGNKTEAAKVLRVDRKTLYRKLERYGVA
jgi:two-component system response regulator HydG